MLQLFAENLGVRSSFACCHYTVFTVVLGAGEYQTLTARKSFVTQWKLTSPGPTAVEVVLHMSRCNWIV